MKETSCMALDGDDDAHMLLDTLVLAHQLALQMRILSRGEQYQGREATEFLAEALSEWARLVEDDLFPPQEPFTAPTVLKRH
jgi:hypothetical protein